MIQIDVIGTMYEPGTYDAEGNELTAPVALPGWNVNTTHPIAAWQAKRVTPATPRRVFAGAQTVFYTFDSQAEFDAAMVDVDLSEPKEVPRSVSPRQIRQALTQLGMRKDVEDAIAAGDQNLKDWWNSSTAFERANPQVEAMAYALGVSDTDVDAIWELAATL